MRFRYISLLLFLVVILGMIAINIHTSAKVSVKTPPLESPATESIDAVELANELVKNSKGLTTKGLPTHQREIDWLKKTITRLQEQPNNKYKQDALKKLQAKHPEEAAKLLKQALLELESSSPQYKRSTAADWVDIGNILYLVSAEEALEAYQYATKLNPESAVAWYLVGYIRSDFRKLNEAAQAYEEVLALAEEDKSLQASAYGNIGNIYVKQGELKKARYAYSKALEIAKTLDESDIIAGGYLNLGNFYKNNGDLDRALDIYSKALEISKADEDRKIMASAYGNIGNIYEEQGKLKKAEEFHYKALKIHEENGNRVGIAADYGNLGLVHLERGELGKAREMLNKVLILHEQLGDKWLMALDNVNLGIVSERQGNIPFACQYWQKGVELFNKVGSNRDAKKIQGWIDNTCQ